MSATRRKLTAAETLTLIADRAGELREAGVLSVQLDGFAFQLAPYAEPAAAGSGVAVERETHSDPLSDPATYQGGRVPGFDRIEEEEPS